MGSAAFANSVEFAAVSHVALATAVNTTDIHINKIETQFELNLTVCVCVIKTG